jgi:hypothetical protein
MSKCIIARVPPNEDCILLIGTRSSITSAKLIVETQVTDPPEPSSLMQADGVHDEESPALRIGAKHSPTAHDTQGSRSLCALFCSPLVGPQTIAE